MNERIIGGSLSTRCHDTCDKYMADKDWRCQKYGPLGLIEMMLKGLAMIVALFSLGKYDPDENRFRRITESKIAQITVMGALSLLYLILMIQKVLEKELCGITFNIFTIIAHLIMFVVLLSAADPSEFVFVFAVLFMWGDYAKLGFLYIEDEFEQVYLQRPQLFILTGITVTLYLALMVLQIIVWILDYPVVS